MQTIVATTEAETRAFGAALGKRLRAGDLLLLSGELGAGKTTLVRGLVESLGWKGVVRSPTFNLIQTYETEPSVMHADLYRVRGYEGIGIEDYLSSHLCIIEWPDRAQGLAPHETTWRLTIDFIPEGRRLSLSAPGEA